MGQIKMWTIQMIPKYHGSFAMPIKYSNQQMWSHTNL